MPDTTQSHAIEHPGENLSNDIAPAAGRSRAAVRSARSRPVWPRSLAAPAVTIGRATAESWPISPRACSSRIWDTIRSHGGGRSGVISASTICRGNGDGFAVASPLTTYNATGELEVQATERLIGNLRSQPGGTRCEQVLWAASGSEAVQKALWAALAWRGTRQPRHQPEALARARKANAAPLANASGWYDDSIILATRFGFHGKKGLAGAHDRQRKRPRARSRVRFISFPREECIDTARRAEPLDTSRYEAELNELWRQHGSRIRVLITEPYLGGGGSFHPQPEYLQLLQRFCREHDIVFILDEIQSGFGRTGPMYAFTHYGIEPDLGLSRQRTGKRNAGGRRRRPGRYLGVARLWRRKRHVQRQSVGRRRRAGHARRIRIDRRFATRRGARGRFARGTRATGEAAGRRASARRRIGLGHRIRRDRAISRPRKLPAPPLPLVTSATTRAERSIFSAHWPAPSSASPRRSSCRRKKLANISTAMHEYSLRRLS